MTKAASVDDDRYFDLTALADYSGMSVKTLRRYMADPENPLPNHHVRAPGKTHGRILIAKRAFDAWVARFPPARRVESSLEDAEMDAKVARAVKSIRGTD